MKLSQNFTLAEFTNSETAKKEGYSEQFTPDSQIIENLSYGALNIAEKIRTKFGSFAPTVAYRCERLNKKIGGSSTSMHVTGEAFDETFLRNGVNISSEVFFWLVKNKDKIPFTELIWEKGDSKNPNWLHIGWRKQSQKEILVFNGKSYYNYYGSAMHKEHIKLGLV
jgi:hypothetical protein